MNSSIDIFLKIILITIFISTTNSCKDMGTAKFDGVIEQGPLPVTPAEIPIFLGISTVTDITDLSAKLNWLSSAGAANYHVYDVSSGSPVYKSAILDPSSNSLDLTQLTPGTTYVFRVRMIHNEGNVDNNTTDMTFRTNLAPNTPAAPTLNTPTASPGIIPKPTWEITGVRKDDIVRLYKDDECLNLAGEKVSTGSSVLIQVENSLSLGTYQFSSNSTNSFGNSSECSGANEYTVEPYEPAVDGSSASLLGSTDMTQIISTSFDDNSFAFTLPFNFYLAGNTYTNWYMVSNTYITAGTSSISYSGFSGSSPSKPRIMLGAADNSYQRAYTIAGENFYRIRYEGTAATSGTVGTPNIVYELTYLRPTDTQQFIQVTFGQHARNSGVFGIASASAYYLTEPTITANSSYVLVGDLNGSNWVLYPNSKVIGSGINK